MNPIQYRNRRPLEYLPNDFRLAIKSKRFYSHIFLVRRKRRKLPGIFVGIVGMALLVTGELIAGSTGTALFVVSVGLIALGAHFELMNRLVRQFKYFVVPSVAAVICLAYVLIPQLFGPIMPRQHRTEVSRFSSGFHFDSRKLTVHIGGKGGFSVTYTKRQLEESKKDSASISGTAVPFTIYLDGGKLYVDADVFAGPDNPSIRIRRNTVEGMPFNWDGNYDSSAFEIVSPDTIPVFQLTYTLENNIMVKGVFRSQGRLVIADESGVIKTNSNRVLFYATKPIFKYPSWKYPHRLSGSRSLSRLDDLVAFRGAELSDLRR